MAIQTFGKLGNEVVKPNHDIPLTGFKLHITKGDILNDVTSRSSTYECERNAGRCAVYSMFDTRDHVTTPGHTTKRDSQVGSIHAKHGRQLVDA